MAEVIAERVCAEVEGPIVVFLIGMRINRVWKVWQWLPVMLAMVRMLRELGADPAIGMLGSRTMPGLRSPSVVQYWKSAAHLRAYAQGAVHRPAWAAFNRRVGTSGDVGIWHETFVVPAGSLETVYVNMPPSGLGRVGTLFPATGRRGSAGGRLGGEHGCGIDDSRG